MGFVVEKVALGQDFYEYFGSPWKSLFHQILLSSSQSPGADTIGQ
jgi:hypothetical protein